MQRVRRGRKKEERGRSLRHCAIPVEGKILFRGARLVTACTKLSVIYEPVQLPGTGPSALKIHGNAKIDGRAVAVIIIINHRGQRTRSIPSHAADLYCLLARDVL